ncbi:hypothetical protein BC831DRAFT_461370 [Entophlyctis helioformis]|nr:hypothetical protein BC831DRAFT_461370 [Entophlyctis helioformis]
MAESKDVDELQQQAQQLQLGQLAQQEQQQGQQHPAADKLVAADTDAADAGTDAPPPLNVSVHADATSSTLSSPSPNGNNGNDNEEQQQQHLQAHAQEEEQVHDGASSHGIDDAQQRTLSPEPPAVQNSARIHGPKKEPVDGVAVEEEPERDVVYMAFGPRGAFYVRWSDGSSAWENIPPMLHTKLYGRMKHLPSVQSMSMPEMNQWITVFSDGSFATSGFPLYGKLKDALQDPPVDSELKSLVFAPGGGWLLTRDDGTMAWERLPTGLDELLRRRTRSDAPLDRVAISGYGGWFVRFADGECEWEAIPKPLEKLLIQHIRHGDPNIVVALSPTDGHSYFVAVGDTAEWVHDSASLRLVLEWSNGNESIALPESVVINPPLVPLASPSPSSTK